MKFTNIPRYALAASLIAGLGACSGEDGHEGIELDKDVTSENIVEYPTNLLVDGKTVVVCEGTSAIFSSKNFKSGGHTTVSGEETARCYDGNPAVSPEEAKINTELQKQAMLKGEALLPER